MKYLICLILSAVTAGLVSCDDDTVCVCPDPVYTITGRVLYEGSMSIEDNARIYISYGDYPNFHDTTSTDIRGAFSFEGAYQGEFRLFAGRPDGPLSLSFSYVTPITELMDNAGLTVFCAGDILLYEVVENSSVTGHVEYIGVPVEGADVSLISVGPGEYFLPDATVTDAAGNYSFSGVKTDDYVLFAYKEGAVGETDLLFCDGAESYAADTIFLELGVISEKPAIYIYPDSDKQYQVRLELVNGTELTASEPEYGNGWNVFVETTGLIDDTYDYLFYEAAIPQVPELEAGWCIGREDLPDELQGILYEIGLNEKETEDFLEHWLGRLTEYDYYSVFPVLDNSLDQYVELRVSPEPDARLRFWLFFKGALAPQNLDVIPVTSFQRGSTTVIEWGGVLLN